MWKEFKEFAFKGNVIDLSVAVIIGGAFGNIVTSLVNDLIMPMLTSITGKTKFTDLQYIIYGENAIKYGNFIQAFIDFLFIALSIFLMIKVMHAFKKKEDTPEPKAPTSEELLTEIRDLLKASQK